MARRLATNSACQAGSSKMPPCPRSGWCITCEQGATVWSVLTHLGQLSTLLAGPMQLVVFGLPGNPVSSIVTFNLVVLPALRAMAGWPVCAFSLYSSHLYIPLPH